MILYTVGVVIASAIGAWLGASSIRAFFFRMRRFGPGVFNISALIATVVATLALRLPHPDAIESLRKSPWPYLIAGSIGFFVAWVLLGIIDKVNNARYT